MASSIEPSAKRYVRMLAYMAVPLVAVGSATVAFHATPAEGVRQL
jgi:hypothetical protein